MLFHLKLDVLLSKKNGHDFEKTDEILFITLTAVHRPQPRIYIICPSVLLNT